MSTSTLRIALTPGEPAGIGPDLVAQLAQSNWPHQIVVIADPEVITSRAAQLGLEIKLNMFDSSTAATAQRAGEICVLAEALAVPCQAGVLNPKNGAYVLNTLHRAVEGCQSGLFDALVTAPVNKAIINEAGISFSGHTEFLAEKTNTEQVVMLLATEQMKVALVTTHLPLSAVPAAITDELLSAVISIVHRELQLKYAIQLPRIAVLGLNPHAGESGHMGREEIDTIIPCLENLRKATASREGMNLIGPLPADTAFNNKVLDQVDAVVAMYHDQGLPVLKYSGFGQAVNITLGLPIIRTSVDHGTAINLAGKGGVDSGSLRYALDCAADMALRQYRD